MAIHHAGHSDGITVRGSFWMRFATVTPMLSVFRFVPKYSFKRLEIDNEV